MAYTAKPTNKNLAGLLNRLATGDEVLTVCGDSIWTFGSGRMVDAVMQEWPANWAGVAGPGGTNNTGAMQANVFTQPDLFSQNLRQPSDATPGQSVTGGLTGMVPGDSGTEFIITNTTDSQSMGDWGFNSTAPDNPRDDGPWWEQDCEAVIHYAIGPDGTPMQQIRVIPRRGATTGTASGNLALESAEGFHSLRHSIPASIATGVPWFRLLNKNTGSPDHFNLIGYAISVLDGTTRKPGFCLNYIGDSGQDTGEFRDEVGTGIGAYSDECIEHALGHYFPSSSTAGEWSKTTIIAVHLTNWASDEPSDFSLIKTHYEAMRARMLARATAAGSTPAFLWIVPWQVDTEPETDFSDARRDALLEIATENSDMYISLYDIYEGETPDEVSSDGVHPNDETAARAFAAALWGEIENPIVPTAGDPFRGDRANRLQRSSRLIG